MHPLESFMSLACWRRGISVALLACVFQMGVQSVKWACYMWLLQHPICAFRQIATGSQQSSLHLYVWYQRVNHSLVGLLCLCGSLNWCMHICVYKHKQTSNCAGWLDFQGMVSGSWEIIHPYTVRKVGLTKASRPDLKPDRSAWGHRPCWSETALLRVNRQGPAAARDSFIEHLG